MLVRAGVDFPIPFSSAVPVETHRGGVVPQLPVDGTHDAAAVPALRWGHAIAPAGPDRMTEAAAAAAPVRTAAWPLSGSPVEAAA